MLHVALLLAAGITWTNDVPEALAKAATEGRPLLLQFRDPLCEATRDSGGQAVGRAGGRPAHGSVIRGDILSPCARMEEDVWGHAETARAAARFVSVLVPEGSTRDVHRRYEVGTLPTALVADPWGNEIVRMINYVERERFVRILDAMPASFGPVSAPAQALARDPEDAAARFALGRFYEQAGLREVAEKYYEKAALLPKGRALHLRRDLALARGLNLLRLGQAARAGEIFHDELAAGPAAADDDVLLLGVTLSLVQQKKGREARAAVEDMEKRFPKSPYTAKAREAVDR